MGKEQQRITNNRWTRTSCKPQLMSAYTKFAIVGAGRIGNCIVQELLKEKAAGIVKEVAVLTREVRVLPMIRSYVMS
jgi:hypothetical protein